MDGKQLKNSILQWAIQGKLVPQNPKDEPAQKLLDRIAAIRHSEQSEESSKRSKKTSKTPTSRIYRENGVWYEQVGNAEPKDISDDIPFEIPESWVLCRVKDICSKITDGTHHSPKNTDDGDYKYVTAKNIKEYGIQLTNISYVEKKVHDEIFARCNPSFGDILYIKDGATTGICCINNLEEPFSLLSSVALLKPKEEIFTPYLLYFLRSPACYDSVRDSMKGTGITRITLTKIEKWIIPFPPLAEQKRIVAKLEKILPLVDEYNAAQEQLDELNKDLPEALKKSILQQAIQGKLVPQNPKDEPAQKLLDRITAARSEGSQPKGAKSKKSAPSSRIYCENGIWYEQIGNAESKDISDEIPFDIPTSWVWTRMGNIGSWGAGATPAKGNPAFYKDGVIPWLVTGELNNSIVTETKTKVSKIALEKCSLRLCKPGDVLIAMYGATIGKLAIAGIELTTNQACCACSLHYDYNKYLFYFLMASKSDLIKRGEGGAQPNISKEKLVNYLIPLPPLAEQKRIVTKLEQLFKVL